MSWPPYTATGGASSGAVVTPAEVTTGSIAAGGASEDVDVDLGFDAGQFTAVVTRTAGASTSVAVLWYADAARTILNGAICGSSFAGATPDGDGKVYGPQPNLGGTVTQLVGHFRDADATGLLHLRVYNHDFSAEVGTFNVAIKAIET